MSNSASELEMSTTVCIDEYFRHLTRDKLNKHVHLAAWTVPEVSFWTCTIPTAINSYRPNTAIEIAKVDASWAFIDGIAFIFIGLTQLLDQRTHRPWIMKTKGTLNLGSGLFLTSVQSMLMACMM